MRLSHTSWISRRLQKLVVTASLLGAQQGLSKGNVECLLLDETRLAIPMVIGWDYSQVRKCKLEQVASDLAMITIAMARV